MARLPNKYGGGSKTNINGLEFERTTSLDDALIKAGYHVNEYRVYDKTIHIGMSLPKHKLYNLFLHPNGIDYRDYNSKKWLPDEVFVNFGSKKIYIIEKKFQEVGGSVDEKLPGCHFKKLEYQKLATPIGYKVEFAYVLCDWFNDNKYKDTLEYIEKMECYYFFNLIPLSFLDL